MARTSTLAPTEKRLTTDAGPCLPSGLICQFRFFFSFWHQICEKHFCCCTKQDLKTKTQTGRRPVAVSSSHVRSHYKCSTKIRPAKS